MYAENDVFVIDFASDEPLFGYIDSIWYYNGDAFLLCDMIIICQFDCHYNIYEVECLVYLKLLILMHCMFTIL